MFSRIEKIVDKILPDLDRGTKERKAATDRVVDTSLRNRDDAEKAVIKAYADAGVALSQGLRGRRWDDR